MASVDIESTLTDRYQTTIPESVRRALKLGKRDKIHYAIRPGGEVLLSRAPVDDDDPVLGEFLEFLAQDIAMHPERVRVLNGSLVKRIRALVGDADLDLDAPLSADDE